MRGGGRRDLDAPGIEPTAEVHRLHPVQPATPHPMAELGNRDDPRADAAHDGEEVADVVVVAVGDQGKVEAADVTQPGRAERVAVSPRVNDDLAPLRAGQPECRMPEEGHLSATGGTHVPHGPGLGGGRQGGRPITVLTRCKRPAAGRERGADVDHDNAQLAALRLTVPGQPKCSWEHEMMTGTDHLRNYAPRPRASPSPPRPTSKSSSAFSGTPQPRRPSTPTPDSS